MKRLANFIVEKRKLFIIGFLAVTLFFAFFIPRVVINYDQSVYLPEDSETAKGLAVMKDEFGGNGTLSVMVKDITLLKAVSLRADIEKVDGVRFAIFLDTILPAMKTDETVTNEEFVNGMLDLLTIIYKIKQETFPDRSLGYIYELLVSGFMLDTIPMVELPAINASDLDMLDGYYKDSCALISVMMTESDYSAATLDAVERIIPIASAYGETYLTGQSAAAYLNKSDNDSEIITSTIIGVIFILAILFLTSSSFAEPLIYLMVIVAAIALNMGTNIIFGSISNTSNTVSALLQLALSIDYSVFLLHSFKDEKEKDPDPVRAMKRALGKSLSTISGSSLTTVAGFIALTFMTFGIGLDFGLVLAKGILLSLISVFVLMPGIVVGMNKLLDSTKHRKITEIIRDRRIRKNPELAGRPPFLHKAGDFILKFKNFVPVVFLILMIPLFFLQSGNQFFFGDTTEDNKASSYMNDAAAVTKVFGRQNMGVILISNEFSDREEELCDDLRRFSFVKSVTNYALVTAAMEEDSVPAEIKGQFKGINYNRIIVVLDLPDEGGESFAAVEKIDALLEKSFGEDGDYMFLGTTKSIYEIRNYSLSDSMLISLLTLLFIVLILAATFRSAAVPLILGVVIQGAAWLNMSFPYLMGEPMSFIGYIIVNAIQMGATVDYGILLTDNYIAERRLYGKREAMRRAIKSSFSAMLISGSILTIVGFSLYFSKSIIVQILGVALGRGTLIALLCMLTVLPGALVLLDKFIMKTTWKGKKNMIEDRDDPIFSLDGQGTGKKRRRKSDV